MGPIEQAVRDRRSVRTFDGKPLSSEDGALVSKLLSEQGNPFGVPVEFRALDTKEHGLKSPVIAGEFLYVAAKAENVPDFEAAVGYEFERFCLKATAAGLGTVMLASSLNREAFEEAMELTESEVMPVASPVGHAARRQSIREAAMRKAVGADKRLAFEEVFFKGSYGTPLAPKDAGRLESLLEAVRLAPSAVNKQPWRVIVEGEKAHFYELHSLNEVKHGDVQKVDIGIALAHFEMVAEELGIKTACSKSDPGFEVPEDVDYIVSCEIV